MNDEEADDETSGRESSRERSARMRAVAAIANALVKLGPGQLANVPLPPEVAFAVTECQRFTKNARARQLRRVCGLLRAIELAPVEAALHEIATGRGARSKREQSYERWRTRLLEGGDAAMTAFVAAHPGADVQQLRQTVRGALRGPETPRGKAASRELLRAIRSLGEAALGGAGAPDEPTDDEDDDPSENEPPTSG